MSFCVVFDCESDATFRSLGHMPRELAFTRMQATVVCALALPTDQCKRSVDSAADAIHIAQSSEVQSWWRDVASADGRGPFAQLFDLFDSADCIVAYNGLDFDFPLLRKHYGTSPSARRRYIEHRAKCFDPFHRIKSVTNCWCKLDDLLKLNNLPTKTGDGLLAIKLWESNNRSELEQYCSSDVRCLTALTLLKTVKTRDIGVLPRHVVDLSSAVAMFNCFDSCGDLEQV
jgi:hypothetical protein